MSSKETVAKTKVDRRVLRTREQLGDALVALIQEKPFESITVQDVLDRAEVGRSTFYTHYRDKNDLFLSDVDEFFEMMSTALSKRGDLSERVAPVQELFSHIADMQPFYSALTAAGRIPDVMELGREHFARGIEKRLGEIPRGHGIPAAERAPLAHAHAGALLSLLSWWIDRGMVQSAAEMDALFHRNLWQGVPPETR